jgi:hypothetical protein
MATRGKENDLSPDAFLMALAGLPDKLQGGEFIFRERSNVATIHDCIPPACRVGTGDSALHTV